VLGSGRRRPALPLEAPKADTAPALDADEILKQEFGYARETALQANSDRTQVVNLYLILVGGVGSILLGLPSLARGEGIEVPRATYAVVFFILGLLGVFSVLKLIRLRLAWYDSVLAMNAIKDFYLGTRPELAPAFRWRTETTPPPGKPGSISLDLAVLVALVDSLALGAGVFFLELPVWAAGAAAAAFLAGQIGLYFRLLGAGRA
jgi:hypothetical protein